MKSNQFLNEGDTWDEADLVRRLCHALDIANLALEQLGPTGYANSKDAALNVRSEKVICETAVLLLNASAVPFYSEAHRRITQLAEALIPYAHSERMLLGLCLEPSVAWDYALPYVCLKRLGYCDSRFDGLLSQSVNSQGHAGRERVPHRMLEQEWIAKGWDESLRKGGAAGSQTARISILNNPMDLFGGTRDDIYAFTHALMYVTDFNLRPAPLPRQHSIILAEAEAALARCLDDEDYDLGGELLLSWPLTGESWSSAAAFAFRVLARVEDQAGFLPTPATRISELNALEGVERKRYLIATAYHTAYVMGLVCAASLRNRACAPPTSIPVTKRIQGSAKQVMAALDAFDRQRPHWRVEYEQLTEPEADSIAGFLVNVGLRRRIASRDFSGAREFLALAYDLHLANTPAVSQAAELLSRITVFSKRGDNSEEETSQDSYGSSIGDPLSF
jgi:hypothetical protein